MRITPDCLDRWLGDFDEFRPEFLEFCWMYSKALGFAFSFSQEKLAAAHAGWKADHDLWLAECMGADSSGLSHIKIMGLLLHRLCSTDWLGEIREFPNEEFKFNGTDEDREASRDDYKGGPESFLAFHFAMQVIGWFEQGRTDKSTPFAHRMTVDMFHDMMFYLTPGRHDKFGTVLILKAIYMRD